jgi:hypothetical protein
MQEAADKETRELKRALHTQQEHQQQQRQQDQQGQQHSDSTPVSPHNLVAQPTGDSTS